MMGRIWAVAAVVLKELYRRKDVYVLFILTVILTLMAGSVNFFNDHNIVRYVKEICLLLIWIASLVIAVTMAARHIPMERESRTIFPLLAKPITRTEVLLGKFVGCWVACVLSMLVFYAFFGVVCMAREHDYTVINYLQAFLLHTWMLAIIVAMTLVGSLVFAAPSSTNTIILVVCTGILMVGRHLGKVAMAQHEPMQTLLLVLYYVIPHLEFFDVRDLIIHAWPALTWTTMGLAGAYAAVCTTFFLAMGAVLFRRKSLT
ncbi:MAG: ABC transporter permease [Lentisphaerae bacterium]|nr:ABC transporter permease [Lentisphaerota bacterium]